MNFIHWINGGIIPISITATDDFEKALILNDEYLDFIHERTELSRKEFILKKFPGIKLIPVKVTLMDV